MGSGAHRDVCEDAARAPLAVLPDDLAGESGGEVSLFPPSWRFGTRPRRAG